MALGANIFASSDVGPVSARGGGGANVAFGPTSSGGQTHPLHPSHSFGASFWIGVGAVALLWFIRHNLPA